MKGYEERKTTKQKWCLNLDSDMLNFKNENDDTYIDAEEISCPRKKKVLIKFTKNSKLIQILSQRQKIFVI